MTQRFAIGPRETATLDTTGLREHFLIESQFVAGEIALTYTHYDRMIVGGAQPAGSALAFGLLFACLLLLAGVGFAGKLIARRKR